MPVPLRAIDSRKDTYFRKRLAEQTKMQRKTSRLKQISAPIPMGMSKCAELCHTDTKR